MDDGGKTKLPYCFAHADDAVFAFAGLWDRWKSPDGEQIFSCSIVTTTANELVSGIHDRMPVILKPENYDLWLDPGFTKTAPVLDLLKPANPESMRRWRVSPRVNSVLNDDARCSDEYHPEPMAPQPQGMLFQE